MHGLCTCARHYDACMGSSNGWSHCMVVRLRTCVAAAGAVMTRQAVFTIALVVFVPVLIAFHSAAEECTFVLVRSPVSAPDPLAPPQPASAMQFMLLTNLAFLVSKLKRV